MDSAELLRKHCNDGFTNLFGHLTKEESGVYIERARHELDVIHKLGFDDYFLFINDIVRFARERY